MTQDALSDFRRYSIHSARLGESVKSDITVLMALADTSPAGDVFTVAPRTSRHQRARQPSTRLWQAIEAHRAKVASFSTIGAAVFLGGLGLQAVLVQVLGFTALTSYAVQAIASIEASFLLNRRFTWPDRDVPFWLACWRFNAQKAALSVLNFLAYGVLVRFGLNYLVANVMLTVVFTVINYVGGDRWSFALTRRAPVAVAEPEEKTYTEPDIEPGAALPEWPASLLRDPPTVSIIVPCKDNARTIRATVESLLGQDYPGLKEVILVGSPGDTTWSGLQGLRDPRLVLMEQEAAPGVRDPNVKRDKGIQSASGQLLALADSDIVMDRDWLSMAVLLMHTARVDYVAGGMRSIHDNFWGRFVDRNRLAAKTPRVNTPYLVTPRNFGRRGRKPPITANALFTRDLYNTVPLDVAWAFGYEDYEWMWRVTRTGRFRVLYSHLLSGRHHHRRSFRQLITEYSRAAEGCAHFIRTHPNSPLARKRRRQAVMLPALCVPLLAGAGAAVAAGGSLVLLAATGVVALAMMGREVVSARRLEAVVYPYAGVTLGMVFTWSLATNLIRTKATMPAAWVSPSPPVPLRTRLLRRVCWPLTAVLGLQAVLSLTLVWSNTAFGDEADYLLQGRLEWAHWLHGAPLPALHDSGAPQIYPLLGGLAYAAGGLAGARILSLCFMLGASLLLFLTARRLFGSLAALTATALWAVSEPTLRLAFATFDPLSVLLVALSAWLALQAGYQRRRGEFVVASAVALALGGLVAFSFAIMIPVVIAFAFLAWLPVIGARQARFCAAWLGVVTLIITIGAMTVLRLWPDAIGSTVGRSRGVGQGVLLVARSAWSWNGVIAVLAVAGLIASLYLADRRALLLVLAGSAFLVPVYQAHIGTDWSLDKHMAAGAWFGAMAAGYAGSVLLTRARWQPVAAWAVAVALLAFPAINGWNDAWQTYHLWPNETRLVAALRPLTSHTTRLIGSDSPVSPESVPQFYLMTGHDWAQWESKAVSVQSVTAKEFGVIILGYDGKVASTALTSEALSSSASLRADLLRLSVRGNRTLYAVTQLLQRDPAYRLAAIVPYSSDNTPASPGFYGVWALNISQHAGS